ncbi:DUF3644 domain-containing protein [Rubritalea tangerina]|uniref:DUF3644 domain-containing protein n=1 Tax=Rubritalea tangerina TaxID=430798 RepID=A0ABW4ZEW6_9BACT
MKARKKELLDRSIAAMLSAIEIYNKPDFAYREETFAILAINGWELLLKAKWLDDHKNQVRSLYVKEHGRKKDGTKSKKLRIKKTRSGNPFTHSLEYLANQLVSLGKLDKHAKANIDALTELRDSSIHFYNNSGAFPIRLQEIGAACMKNFVSASKDWFDRDLSEYNFYLMPLSFVTLPRDQEGLVLNPEETNFIEYLESLEPDTDSSDHDYAVTVNIELKFIKSKTRDALAITASNSDNAAEVRLTEEQVREKYPWDYNQLTSKCRERYSDFKCSKPYHELRKELEVDEKYANIRLLDPEKPKGSKKTFYNPNILQELDKHYLKQ